MQPEGSERSTAAQAAKNRSGPRAWWIALAVLCFGIIKVGWWHSPNNLPANPFDRFAYISGACLMPTIFLWLLYAVIFMWRPHRLAIGLSAFAAIYAPLIVAGEVSALPPTTNVAQAAPFEASRSANPSVFGTQQAQEIDRINKDAQKIHAQATAQARSLTEAYHHDIQATGWPTLFNAQRIESDRGLRQSKQIIHQANALVLQYRARSNQLFDSLRSQMQADTADLTPRHRAEVLSGYDDGLPAAKQQFDKLWNLEQDIVNQASNVFDVLGHSNGWQVQDGHFHYSDPATRAAVRSAITAIRNDVAQERQLAHEMQAQSTST